MNQTHSNPTVETPSNAVGLPRSVSYFSLNHPKNYFGVPLAVAAPGETESLIESNLVQMTDRAKVGAEALGLVSETGDLTDLGETIVRTVQSETTLTKELKAFEDLKGTSERFVDTAPRYWDPIARHVLQQNPLTGDIVTLLEKTGPVTLPEITNVAVRNEHPFSETVLRDPDAIKQQASVDDAIAYDSPEIYAGQAVYQFKNILFHCGILTERGSDTSALVPGQDVWALDSSLIDLGGEQ